MQLLFLVAFPAMVSAQAIVEGSQTIPGNAPPWDVGGRLTVGNTGFGQLIVNGPAVVNSTEGYVGTQSSAQGNVYLHTGSAWNNAGDLFVGYQGSGLVTVEEGSTLTSATARLGEFADPTFSKLGSVLVRGVNSSWINSGAISLGVGGRGFMAVEDGAQVSSAIGALGIESQSIGTANVSGAGSSWTNTGGLFVGIRGFGTLNVEAGGTVTSAGGVIGRYATDVGWTGQVHVRGENSLWNLNGNELRIGGDSTDPLTDPGGVGFLTIEDKGRVTGGAVYLGDMAPATGTATVKGAGSRWTVNGLASVGRAGTGTVNITDGGAMTSVGTVLGDLAGATGNVSVSGAGSTLTDTARISVGRNGTGTLNVTDGAVVGNTSALIGHEDSGRGAVTVSGAGSQFNNSSHLYVGNVGQGTLTVSAGGQVNAVDGYVGAEVNAGALTSTATVTGANSAWTNTGDLFVGHNGKGVLNVEDGGAVSSVQAILGDLAGSQGTVTVSGADASLSAQQDFNVGRFGAGTLTVKDGGELKANRSIIGNEAGSTGTATVTGADALWVSTTRLSVGSSGNGLLTVSDGATVRANEIAIALLAGSTGVLHVGGAVAAAAAGALDTGTLRLGAGNATLDFNHTDVAYVLDADIVGTGTVNQRAGTTIWTGANSYTGTTTLSGGTLQVGNGGTTGTLGAGAITNNAALAFDRGDAITVANVISGNGSVSQNGSGNLILTGVNTYTGATSVNSGLLSVNGSITSATTVNAGGTLGGSGTVGNVTVGNGGTLAPGNSIGTLTVNGDLTFEAGSAFTVETLPDGNADRVNAVGASGLLTINGGTVDVQAGGSGYQRNTTYTLLTSAGARTGEFDSVTSNAIFLTPTLSYEGNAVLLTLQNNAIQAYTTVANTPNQRRVAGYLDSFANAPGNPEAAGLIQQLDNLTSEAEARQAFDSLSGSQHAAASQIVGAVGRNFSGALMGRSSASGQGVVAGTAFASGRPTQYAALDLARFAHPAGGTTLSDGPSTLIAAADLGASGTGFNAASVGGLWGQANGTGGRTDSNGNGASSDYDGRGFILGFDQMVSANWLAGAALGYSRTDWDANANGAASASGKIESPQVGVYGRYTSGPWALRLDATYSRHDIDADRNVTIGGVTSVASSSHQGKEWGFAAEADYAIQSGDWQVRPLVGLRYANLKEDGFTETGAGAANLTVASRRTDNTTASAGVKFSRAFATASGANAGGMEFRAIASHLMGDNDSPISARLAGQPASFTASGTPLKRTALTLGAAVGGQLTRGISAYADAAYELRGSGQDAFKIAAGLRMAW
ncbi:MAG: autotransporter domain-containing protein [Polaromonas sp.]|nr:autotransporter domain-containing protein [Polaromonas sp.]